MLKGFTPLRKFTARFSLFLVMGVLCLTVIAAGSKHISFIEPAQTDDDAPDAITVAPGTGFSLDGQGSSPYDVRPTGADFTTGTTELVLQIVSHTSTGGAIDFDGDGNREIIVQTIGLNATSQTQTRLYIFEAEANNDFRRRSSVLVDQGNSGNGPGLLRGIDVGDVDGDAALEIVAASGVGSSSFLTIYDINPSTFAFSELAQTQIFGTGGLFTTNGTINQVRILPNKNGGTNNDILLSNATGTTANSQMFAVEYDGVSSLVFVNATAANSGIVVNSGVISFDHGDFGDAGDEELIMTTEISGVGPLVIREYVASATAPFGAAKTITTNWTGTTVGSFTTTAVGDIDGDGDLDAVVTDYTGKFIQAVKRTGANTYTTEPIYAVALAAFSPSVEIGDFDGDGKREVIYSRGSTVIFREHDGTADSFASGNFGPETTLLSGLNLGVANAISFVGSASTLDNDADKDFVIGRSTNVTDSDMDSDELFFLEVTAATPTNTPTFTPTPTATETATSTPTPEFEVTGIVTYGNSIGSPAPPRYVSNVLISGAGSPSVSDITDGLGAYTLSGFGAGSYTVTPSKANGSSFITSFDCARIAQYITGNISFTATQVTVADVTGNGDISSFDAALIARYILALGAPMGLSGDWIFSPVSRNYPSVTGSVSGEDYVALKMGEVSGNWEDPGNRPAESNGTERRTAVTAPHLVAVPGSELTIPITVQGAADKGIVAYQFDLRYDPSVIHPQADAAVLTDTASRALTAVVNAEQPGLLRVVVYGAMPITSNGVLLNLKFTAVGQVGSISPLTWEQMMFNEGDPMTTVSNGQIELSYAIGD